MLSEAEDMAIRYEYEITSMEREALSPVAVSWECRALDGNGDECGARFESLATDKDWQSGKAATTCPACGALLSQEADPCRLVADEEEVETIRRDERQVSEVYE